jgi:YegS/Rv2252/BmrU family lipid kinase
MKFVFIVNPIAGSEDKARIFKNIKSAFRDSDHEMIIEETQAQGDAKDIAARYAAEYGADCVVVACGGDGTVHEVANGLAHTETPMLLLPMGTGNDFAKKVYGTKEIDAEKIISQFGFFGGDIQYEVKPIDLIDYNGEKCINVMSFGLDTIVETIGRKMVAKAPFLGQKAYTVAILPVLMKPLHYTISFDVTCVDENGAEYNMAEDNKDFVLFAICNASYYGGGFCPAPDSVLDDGLLDFALVNGMALHKALPIIPKYSKGTANEKTCPGVITNGRVKCGRIWMEDGSPLLGNCDGENFSYSDLTFKVEEKALKMCFLK